MDIIFNNCFFRCCCCCCCFFFFFALFFTCLFILFRFSESPPQTAMQIPLYALNHVTKESCVGFRKFHHYYSGVHMINCDRVENLNFFCEVPKKVVKNAGTTLSLIWFILCPNKEPNFCAPSVISVYGIQMRFLKIQS